MRKLIVLAVLALALPSAALAKPPATHTNHSHAAPKVMYVLKGTFTAFTAPANGVDGSITMMVTHANRHARALVNQPSGVTFAVAANTRITNAGNLTIPGAKGMLKFKAPPMKSATGTDLVTALPSMAKAFHVIVQKAAG